jgi:hypothetical protein
MRRGKKGEEKQRTSHFPWALDVARTGHSKLVSQRKPCRCEVSFALARGEKTTMQTFALALMIGGFHLDVVVGRELKLCRSDGRTDRVLD